jgi:hypothetical protein
VAIVLFIAISALTAFLVRMLGVYMLPARKGQRRTLNLVREVTRVLLASLAAWTTYVVAPDGRSLILAVIVGSFVGAFLTVAE